ncbi:unnamed protein product [Durusdinium trenchii]|uniref:Charged multivesicular body protein 5 n=2 Tax=Durusdinium trenchii TaxID=1381693 RepID=A0ABP0JU40_9DINO
MTVDVPRNRWAKHAAERDQQIQSAAIAMQVLLPELSEEKIKSCLRANSCNPDRAFDQLADPMGSLHDFDDDLGDALAAIEAAGMADVAAEAKSDTVEEVSIPPDLAADRTPVHSAPTLPAELAALVKEVAEAVPVLHSDVPPAPFHAPRGRSTPREERPAPSGPVVEVKEEVESKPSVPDWLPMLKPVESNVSKRSFYDKQTDRLKAALGPAPKVEPVPSAHERDVRGLRQGG